MKTNSMIHQKSELNSTYNGTRTYNRILDGKQLPKIPGSVDVKITPYFCA
jgi:hypothetical protein